MDFFLLALGSLYLILPGAAANIVPVLVRKVDFLNYPIDLGGQLDGKPVFGPNKTYRGFFFGVLSAIAVSYMQMLLYSYSGFFRGISIIDYSKYNFALLGFLMGFGSLFGDLVKSYFKRRLDIRPGASWFPWDQLDALFGAILFCAPVVFPPWSVIFFLLVLIPILHVFVKHIGFYIGINKAKW